MTTATLTVLVCNTAGGHGSGGSSVETRLDRAVQRSITDVVEIHRGQTVDAAGGTTVATFQAANDAISAAMALHRQPWVSSSGLQVSVGVAAGDVDRGHDAVTGTPVTVATCLEQVCQPGDVLVSGVVRLLTGARSDVVFRPADPLELDGVSDPIDVFALVPAAAVPPAVEWRFPANLPTRWSHRFVGRGSEMAELVAAWTRAAANGQQTVVLAGEAGVGKTRLATELALRCFGEGAVVLGGLCDSEPSFPYQPWVMIVDQLVSQLPPTEIEKLDVELSNLAVLIPRLEDLRGGVDRPLLDPEAERLRLFEAVSNLVTAASELAPVLVIVEDLHWAGSQTLELLRFLVKNRPLGRGMIVATMRDTEGEVGDALTSTMADFRRLEAVSHQAVGGIDGVAIHNLLDQSNAAGDLEAKAEAIMERTAGNAFLVTELIDHADQQGDTVPTGVLDVVEGRLLDLGHEARWLVNLIAVAGRVQLSVLAECARANDVQLAIALGEATRSGLVEELRGNDPAYRFGHALIREAVAQRLPAVDEASIHHHLALALESTHDADRRPVLPELARHFASAASLAGWEKAAYYGRRAAAHARRTAAYEEGIDLMERSLEVTPAGSEERALLLIDMVDLLERCGRNPEAVELAEEAGDIGAVIDSPLLQARAGIELERAAHLANAAFDRSPPRLRRVLSAGHSLPDDTRIQTLASYGRALWLNGVAEGKAKTAEALEAALRLGDRETISHALEMCLVVEEDPAETLRLAHELDEVTQGLGNVFQSMWAATRKTGALVDLGRLAEAGEVLARLTAAANQYRFTTYRYLSLSFAHTLALAACDFEGAELAAESANAAEQAEFAGLDVSGAYGLQMFMVRRAQGRLEEMRPVLGLLANQDLGSSVWRPGAVIAYAELEMFDEAEAGLDELTGEIWSDLPRDALWPLALQFLADAAMRLDHEPMAALLLDEFVDLSGRTAGAAYTTNAGPADRGRSIAAELVGRTGQADRAIAAAHQLAVSSRSPLWLAEVEQTWAWILARRGDGAAAQTRLAKARRIAAEHTIGCITAVDPSPPSVDPDLENPPDGLSSREVEVLVELALGNTNRQIAERLFISPNTAANHVRAILRKTGSANRTEAAAYAFGKGLVKGRQ